MVVLLVDDVADRAGAGESQDNGVNPGDVVRQKQFARGYVFQAQAVIIDKSNTAISRPKWSARSAADMEGILYDLQSAPGKLQSAIAMRSVGKETMSGAHAALFLLLAIDLFNYIDRQILAALEPDIRATFFATGDVNAMTKTGLLGDAFFVTYMVSAPILGLLADRFSRWIIIGSAVILWSLASGGSGLAATFAILFATRIFVGIGEGGYGPAAPTILSDLFPIEKRGRIMAIFCAAIPVGSALGYVIGGLIGAHLGWRWAFYLVTPPGLLLGLLCFWQRDPRVAADNLVEKVTRRSIRDYLNLFRTRSYLINCIAQDTDDFCRRRFGILGTGVSALSPSKSGGRHDDLWLDHCQSRAWSRRSWVASSPTELRSASSWFVLLGLRNRDAHRVSVFHCGPLRSVSCGMDRNVPGDFLPVSKHRSFKHGSRERFAACGACNGICRKYLHHPRVR